MPAAASNRRLTPTNGLRRVRTSTTPWTRSSSGIIEVMARATDNTLRDTVSGSFAFSAATTAAGGDFTGRVRRYATTDCSCAGVSSGEPGIVVPGTPVAAPKPVFRKLDDAIEIAKRAGRRLIIAGIVVFLVWLVLENREIRRPGRNSSGTDSFSGLRDPFVGVTDAGREGQLASITGEAV